MGNRAQRRKQSSLTRRSVGPLGLGQGALQLQQLLQAAGTALESGEEVAALATQLEQVLDKVQEVQAKFESAYENFSALEYEQEKQRWVSLRLFASVLPETLSDSILSLEARYRAEYDALQALLAISQLAEKS